MLPLVQGYPAREGQAMRKGLAYLDTAEKCRRLARQVTEPKAKKQLEEMAREWEALAAGRAQQLAKGKAMKRPTKRHPAA